METERVTTTQEIKPAGDISHLETVEYKVEIEESKAQLSLEPCINQQLF